MKTKKVTKEVKVYICSKCNKEYDIPFKAENCEKVHKRETCKHVHVEYRAEDSDYSEGYSFISKTCLDCGSIPFESVSLGDVLTEKVLESLYKAGIKKKKE